MLSKNLSYIQKKQKSFLYSKRAKIFPDKTEIGEKIINSFDREEIIYNVVKFPEFKVAETMQIENDGISVCKTYLVSNSGKYREIKRGFDDAILGFNYKGLKHIIKSN